MTKKKVGPNSSPGIFSLSITIFTILLLLAPVLVLIFSSFNASRFGGAWSGFSFIWYKKLLQEPQLWAAVANSLIVAVTTTIASTILGITAALALSRYKTGVQRFHLGLIYAPLIVPDLLMGVGLLVLFATLNIKLGLGTVFLAHTTFCLSYVAMIVHNRLMQLDRSIIEAAYDLGASSWKIFWKIKLPILLPAIIGGALLAFTLSIDDFVISFFVVGPGATTLPIYVYSMMKFGSPPLVNALSTLLLLATFLLAWRAQKLLKEI